MGPLLECTLTLLIVMGRNLFQLLFGKSIPLEPFPVLDTTNYLREGDVDIQGLRNKTGKSSTNHTTSPSLDPV
jgi:hypothetical protein